MASSWVSCVIIYVCRSRPGFGSMNCAYRWYGLTWLLVFILFSGRVYNNDGVESSDQVGLYPADIVAS